MKFCLIVDDSDVIRKVASKIVESSGFIAIEADSVEEGLKLCQKSMPDMILLDWMVHDVSGLDFLASLRQIDTVRIPQILYAVTEADPQDLARAYRSGINSHILKPFNRHTLQPALTEISKTVEAFA